MNSTVKTIAFWAALLVTLVLLYNVFSRSSGGRQTELTFSRFLEEVQNRNVRSVKIVDSDLTGQLTSGERFKTVVPTDYPAFYDKLQGIEITFEHRAQNPWLSAFVSWGPFLFIFGFWTFVMLRLHRDGVFKKRFNNAFDFDPTNVVHLEPDVAKAFPNSQSVNEALRLVIQLKHIPGTA